MAAGFLLMFPENGYWKDWTCLGIGRAAAKTLLGNEKYFKDETKCVLERREH
jgi:hypothetical protein